MDKKMLNEIIETYRCLISCRKSMPGMSLDDAINSETLADMEKELKYLKGLK